MHIKTLVLTSCLTLSPAMHALAQGTGTAEDMADMTPHDMQKEHGGQIFHMFRMEADTGVNRGDSVSSWDLDGWIGTDEDKLWLKSEGEYSDDELEEAEIWALYSRDISTFWDVQGGVRFDIEPESTAFLVAGFEGLAPYYFETEAHLFVSEHGNVSARLRQENDLLVTQKLVLQPYAEVNLFLMDAPESEAGAGLASAEIGLQTRYEITRKFAPYVDIRYGRKFGETSSIARKDGEDADELTGSVGLRLMF